ncbi:PREDICTED: poly [ADP-ribose] polymerase 1-like isoform X2 [Branchiostoma belcheri]|nr:PREDICTED: poly [ADP-ribose] polymerase 1-like isoform X2 [Branchiostoma belcheri]
MADDEGKAYKAEYAKSNRASCKLCKGNITKDSLRLARMVQSPHFDGKVPNWFHYSCFFKKCKPSSTVEFSGVTGLRWDDQEKLKKTIGGEGSSAGADAGGDEVDAPGVQVFSVEYAKSNRSACRGCSEKIDKGLVRISKKVDEGDQWGPKDLWHHVDCFVEKREELGFTTDMAPSVIQGYKKLSKDDQDILVKKLGSGTTGKRKAKGSNGAAAKKVKAEETEEEKKLKEQSKLVWKIRDELSKSMENSDLKELLLANDQDIPSGESALLDRLSDGMAFGALQRCPECKHGQLFYRSDGYHCSGNLTEWTKCIYTTREPKRKKWIIPDDLKEEVPFLKKFKSKVAARVFSAAHVAAASESTDSFSSSSRADEKKPLHHVKVVLGKTTKSKAEMTKAIEKLGGTVASKVDSTVACVISSKEDVQKMSKKIKDAKAADVHVVSEDFVTDVEKGGAALLIMQKSIASWGSDPHSRIATVEEKPSKSKSKSKYEEMESGTKKLKMMVKGGAAVDPDSGIEHSAHVLEDKGKVYNAVLGLVDLVRGTNSYYKLQVLEADKGNRWYVFRAWGRVGTTVGGNKLETFHSRQGALEQFLNLYEEKTGNEFGTKNFVKYPKRFYPLDIDYGQEEEDLQKLKIKPGSKSTLAREVQEIIQMIFDIESMKKAMVEFEIDLKKMPLGKLSRKQIESAYSVLTELNGILTGERSATRILDASNRFYTLIPHDFGMKKPPMLDNEEVIKAKTTMLDNLLEIEVAYNLLKSGDDGEGKDPIDAHYEKLKCKMEVVEKASDEFAMVQEYVKNTHAKTHSHYTLEVEELFKIAREGEASRYRPFQQLHNRQLLWHGSRVTNYAGILSQGLRIAPPEAPVTGYMFGKGLYFADMVSKSANYCATSTASPTGLLLLCEVALGNMYERKHAEYVSKLPKGMHSTKGLGATGPDPGATKTLPNGTQVPIGHGVPSGVSGSSLLYNEYIVYDVAQVEMKYLIRMKFNYKSLW